MALLAGRRRGAAVSSPGMPRACALTPRFSVQVDKRLTLLPFSLWGMCGGWIGGRDGAPLHAYEMWIDHAGLTELA